MAKRKNFDWASIKADYEAGMTVLDCKKKYHISNGSWGAAVKRGDVVPRKGYIELPIEQHKNRASVRKKILKLELIPNECAICKQQPEWLGKPLAMVLDHINGVNNDHRLENLRFLCPNCNSQTETFGGRNAEKEVRV